MKTVIVVENGRVTVQVEDDEPVVVLGKPEPTIASELGKMVKRSADYQQPPSDPEEQPALKNCIICGDEYRPKRRNQTICGKTECKKEKQRRYAKDHAAKAAGRPPKPESDEEVSWCKRCQAYTTHTTKAHRDEPFTLDDDKAAPAPETAGSPPATTAADVGAETPAATPIETIKRSTCCDGAVTAHFKPNGKRTHTCNACGHLCAINEFMPGHEKSAAEVHQFEAITPGHPRYAQMPHLGSPDPKSRAKTASIVSHEKNAP